MCNVPPYITLKVLWSQIRFIYEQTHKSSSKKIIECSKTGLNTVSGFNLETTYIPDLSITIDVFNVGTLWLQVNHLRFTSKF